MTAQVSDGAREGTQPVEMLLNMGPQHPSTHGVFRMVLWVDGEKVVDVEPHIGYLHRGSEKLCEGEQYHQVVTLFDRMDYIGNFNNELAYCMAVEKLMGLEVPERAEYIRVILCELNRIASHLLYVGTMGLDAGAMTQVMFSFRGRERVQALFEAVSGARMMHNYFRIGGLKEDVPDNFRQLVDELMPLLREDVEQSDRILTFNEIFLSRLKDVSPISADESVALGLTGPLLRACGYEYDVRKAQPYSIYDRFDFEVPVGLGEHGPLGSCWDRYYVRVREMEQSLGLIRQALDRLPEGDVHEHIPRRVRPAKSEVYDRTETPRGELGYYIVSGGGLIPFRVKVKSPCFTVLSLLPAIAKGGMVADIIAIIGSIDIVMGEVDR